MNLKLYGCAMGIRESSIQTAKILKNKGFYVVDTETTGINYDSEIVEIAVIDQDGAIVFHSLIKPLNPIPENVSKIHGITNEMVNDAPKFSDIAQQLYDILNGKNLVAHNSHFDKARLKFEFNRLGISEISVDWFCTMKLTTKHGDKWNRLSESMFMLGIEFEGVSHRALYDAECCRMVVCALADYQFKEEV